MCSAALGKRMYEDKITHAVILCNSCEYAGSRLLSVQCALKLFMVDGSTLFLPFCKLVTGTLQHFSIIAALHELC